MIKISLEIKDVVLPQTIQKYLDTNETHSLPIESISSLIDVLFKDMNCLDKTVSFSITSTEQQSPHQIISKNIDNEFDESVFKLTCRENQVLKLLMMGKKTIEIANELFLSFETVKSYRKNILQKIGVNNTVSLSRLYHLQAIL